MARINENNRLEKEKDRLMKEREKDGVWAYLPEMDFLENGILESDILKKVLFSQRFYFEKGFILEKDVY